MRDVWQDLGPEDMFEYDEDPEAMWDSGGSESHNSGSCSLTGERAYMSGDSGSESDCELYEGLVKRRCADREG